MRNSRTMQSPAHPMSDDASGGANSSSRTHSSHHHIASPLSPLSLPNATPSSFNSSDSEPSPNSESPPPSAPQFENSSKIESENSKPAKISLPSPQGPPPPSPQIPHFLPPLNPSSTPTTPHSSSSPPSPLSRSPSSVAPQGPPPPSPLASRNLPPPSPSANRSNSSSLFSFSFARRGNSTRSLKRDSDVEMGDVEKGGGGGGGKKDDKKIVVRVNFKKEEKETKEGEKEEIEVDDFKLQPRFKLYMVVIWTIALAISIWYTVQQSDQYKQATANPSSTVIIEKLDRLPMPQVTICNWNQNGNSTNPSPLEKCEECELQLVSCQFNTTVDCHGLWSKRQYLTNAGIFSCYEFNAFPFDVLYSSTTGYSGSFATVWSYPLLSRSDPPQNRAGLQVSFYAPGQITPELIYDEVRFAAVGFDAFYALQLVTTIHSELPFYDEMYNETTFNTPVTSVNLLAKGTTKSGNDTIGYTGVSFAFQTLSKQTIYFGIDYTLEGLFGDLAGVIGTLCGLDVIKLSVGFCLAFICWKHKNIDLLADLFNG